MEDFVRVAVVNKSLPLNQLCVLGENTCDCCCSFRVRKDNCYTPTFVHAVYCVERSFPQTALLREGEKDYLDNKNREESIMYTEKEREPEPKECV